MMMMLGVCGGIHMLTAVVMRSMRGHACIMMRCGCRGMTLMMYLSWSGCGGGVMVVDCFMMHGAVIHDLGLVAGNVLLFMSIMVSSSLGCSVVMVGCFCVMLMMGWCMRRKVHTMTMMMMSRHGGAGVPMMMPSSRRVHSITVIMIMSFGCRRGDAGVPMMMPMLFATGFHRQRCC